MGRRLERGERRFRESMDGSIFRIAHSNRLRDDGTQLIHTIEGCDGECGGRQRRDKPYGKVPGKQFSLWIHC